MTYFLATAHAGSVGLKSGEYKTLKYRPDFPKRFGCIEDARGFCVDFFHWYNNEHHHTGLGLHTPAEVHFGRDEQRHSERAVVLQAAQHQHTFTN